MSNVKCALAVMGGYVLGRTRKAKAAIGLGLWISGRNYHAKDVLRDQMVRLVRSADGEQLINQIKGPATEAGRHAAVAVYESQINRLSDALAERTERLTAALGGSAKLASKEGEVVRGAVEGVAAAVKPGTGPGHDGEGDGGSPRRDTDTDTDDRDEPQARDAQDEDHSDADDRGTAGDRGVPDRSGGRRREARRGPPERMAQASTGGGSR